MNTEFAEGPPWSSGSTLDWRPTGRGFEPRLSLGRVSQIFRLIVPGEPCPDMTNAVERDVKPQTFHFISFQIRHC